MSEQPPTYKYIPVNNSSWGQIVLGIVIGAVITALGYTLLVHKLEEKAQWQIKKDALLSGNAYYKPDAVTAEPIFTWNNN